MNNKSSLQLNIKFIDNNHINKFCIYKYKRK